MAWGYGLLIAAGAAVVLTLLVELLRRTTTDPPAPDRDWLARLVRTEVIVHTVSGGSIRGFAQELSGGAVGLTAALYLGDGGSTTPVDGGAVVPREQIAWVQTGIADRDREQVSR